MRLSKQTSDAVKILTVCARADGEPRKAADIAAEVGITKQVGLKLVNMLARLDYVTTVRGPKGGLRLARPAVSISVGQVVRDLEAQRVAQAPDYDDSPGALSPFLDDAFDAFVSVLDAHTIADLAARPVASQAEPGGDEIPDEGSVKAKPADRAAKRAGSRPLSRDFIVS